MGTKSSPGRPDAYAAALPDEPIFTLSARDPLASQLVGIWASIRLGDVLMARYAFDRMADLYGQFYARTPDWFQGESALHVATDMLEWRRARNVDCRQPRSGSGETEAA